MILLGNISLKMNDQPKIQLGAEELGAHQVTFDLYGIDANSIMSLVGEELEITIIRKGAKRILKALEESDDASGTDKREEAEVS